LDNQERIWAKKKWDLKILLVNFQSFAVQILQKSDNNDYIPDLNDNPNIISLNFNLRNIFIFKTFNQKWQIDYIFNQNKQKIPLINGTEYKNMKLDDLQNKI